MLVGSGGNDLTRGDVHHLFAGERLHLGGHGFVVEHHHRRTGAGGNRTGFIGGNRFQDIAVADEADEPAIAVHHGKAGDVEADELAHHMRDVIAVQAAVGLIVHDPADGLFLGLLEQGGGGGHVCAGVVMLGGLAFSGFGRDFGGGLRLGGLGVACGLLLGTAGDGEDADDQGDQRDGGAQQVGERDAAGRGGLHTLGHARGGHGCFCGDQKRGRNGCRDLAAGVGDGVAMGDHVVRQSVDAPSVDRHVGDSLTGCLQCAEHGDKQH